MAHRRLAREDYEAEPVVVRVTPTHVVLLLDDGQRLIFDRKELSTTIS